MNLELIRTLPPFVPIELLGQITKHPELWNKYRERTSTTTHQDISDIWLRFNARENYDYLCSNKFVEEHFASWYHPAIDKLPMVKEIAQRLMCSERAEYLGGVLITKIPPGGRVLPHTDSGWHPEFLNRKLYVVLQSNDKCINRVEDETATMKAGEVWFFDNTREHAVTNNGDTDRITLIVCMRKEP